MKQAYQHRMRTAYGLDAVDRMVQQDIVAIEQRLQNRFREAREQLRGGLRGLLGGDVE